MYNNNTSQDRSDPEKGTDLILWRNLVPDLRGLVLVLVLMPRRLRALNRPGVFWKGMKF